MLTAMQLHCGRVAPRNVQPPARKCSRWQRSKDVSVNYSNNVNALDAKEQHDLSTLAPGFGGEALQLPAKEQHNVDTLAPGFDAQALQLPAKILRRRCDLLSRFCSETELHEFLQSRPEMLLQPLEDWLAFLQQYGVNDRGLRKIVLESPQLFQESTIYEMGCTIMFFKDLGWRDSSIKQRMIPNYPQLLALQVSIVRLLLVSGLCAVQPQSNHQRCAPHSVNPV